MTAVEVVQHIKAWQPQSKVLILSSEQEPEAMVACLAAGANAYLSLHLEPEQLVRAVRDVRRYGLVLAEDVAPVVREQLTFAALKACFQL